MNGTVVSTQPRPDARAWPVLTTFTLLDAAVVIDLAFYLRLIGGGVWLVAPIALLHAIVAGGCFKWLLVGRPHGWRSKSISFLVGFSALPAGGLCGGWTTLHLDRGNPDREFLFFSCVAGFLSMSLLTRVAKEAERAARTKAVDGPRLVAEQVCRGCVVVSACFFALRASLDTGFYFVGLLDLTALFFWIGALLVFGISLRSLRTERRRDHSWVGQVIDNQIDGYRVEALEDFPDAAQIPPFLTSRKDTYVGVLIREASGKDKVLGRIG